jgi:hypothetical protein
MTTRLRDTAFKRVLKTLPNTIRSFSHSRDSLERAIVREIPVCAGSSWQKGNLNS